MRYDVLCDEKGAINTKPLLLAGGGSKRYRVTDLIALCKEFVSLKRGEGFGL